MYLFNTMPYNLIFIARYSQQRTDVLASSGVYILMIKPTCTCTCTLLTCGFSVLRRFSCSGLWIVNFFDLQPRECVTICKYTVLLLSLVAMHAVVRTKSTGIDKNQ